MQATARRVRPRASARVGAALLAAVACAVAVAGAGSNLAVAQAATAPGVQIVASAPPRSLGEAALASSARGTAVVASTGFPSGPVIGAWAQAPGSSAWTSVGSLLPSGFTRSYDASAAALPDGRLVVVAGASVGGVGGCLPGGSVFAATSNTGGASYSTPVIVSDQRGGSGYDDRPDVAAGPGNHAWVGWSAGGGGSQCQAIGSTDVIQVTSSQVSGATSFLAPLTLPSVGPGAAFGVQIAPLGGGRAAVSWAQLSSTGGLEVALATVARSHGSLRLLGQPQVVATATALPLVPPGASFYAFDVPTLATFDGGRGIALAWPQWVSGRGVIEVAARVGTGGFAFTQIDPAVGSDLLLPALAPSGGSSLRLLVAEHQRSNDAVFYASASVHVGAGAVAATALSEVSPALPGPGYFELGEIAFAQRTASAVRAAVVEGGSNGSALVALQWPLATASVGTTGTSPGSSSTSGAPRRTSSTVATSTPRRPAAPAGGATAPVVFAVLGLSVVAALVILRRAGR